MQDKTYVNSCEKDINSDQETITVTKNDISQLLVMGIIAGIVIGATITQLIIYFSL